MNTSQDDEQRGILGEGMSRRGILRRVGGGITTVAAAAAIANIEAHATRAAGVNNSERANKLSYQSTPESGDAATPTADLTYGGRSVNYVQEGDTMGIEIDGVMVDMVAFYEPGYVTSPSIIEFNAEGTPTALEGTPSVVFADGQYFSMYFPFVGYDSLDELAIDLVETEGQLWTLDQ